MAKGDYALVKSEIGGQLMTDTIMVTGAGGKLEIEWDKKAPLLHLRILGRTGKTNKSFTFAVSAVRSLEVVDSEE